MNFGTLLKTGLVLCLAGAGHLWAQGDIGYLSLSGPSFGFQTLGLYNLTGATDGCGAQYNICNNININTWTLQIYLMGNIAGLPASPLTFTSSGAGDIVGPTDLISDSKGYTGENANPWSLSFDLTNAACSPLCDATITQIVFSGTIDQSTVDLYNMGGTPTPLFLTSQNFSVTWNIPSTDYTTSPGNLFDSTDITITNQPLAIPQTITFGALSAVNFGSAPFTVSATVNSGLTVTFASTTTGFCTVSGTTVTIVAAGTCSITASQPGNSSYAAATPVVQSFTISPESQTISFMPLGNLTFGAASFGLSAMATSGMTVAFTSTTQPVCTVTGATVTIVGGGLCSLDANQAGGGNFAGAPTVINSFTVNPAAQTITFGPLNNVAFGVAPFAISASSTSNLTVAFTSTTLTVCTVAGATVTIVGSGPCSITADQAGNASYTAAASVVQGFTVSNLTSQTITFAPLNNQTIAASPMTLSASATSLLAVTLTSNTTGVCTVSGVYLTLLVAGNCSVTATQAGNGTYAPATGVTQMFTVSLQASEPAAGFLDTMGGAALTFNNTTTFPDAGGFLIGPPAVAQANNGDVFIVGLDSAGGVHLNSYSHANQSWNGWQYSGGILDTTSGMTAAVDPSGVVWFTGRDIGNRFWINSWNGSAFGGWIDAVNGIFAADAVPQIAIPADGSIYLIGKDIGGRIWSNSYIPTTQMFTGWVDRQGIIVGQPSATAGQDGFVYVAARNVLSDSPVYILQIPASNGPAASVFLNGGGLIDSDPYIASTGGMVNVTALSAGGAVYLLSFSEMTQMFGAWTSVNGTLSDVTIATRNDIVYIVGRDSGGRIYWYNAKKDSWALDGGAGLSTTVLTGGKQ